MTLELYQKIKDKKENLSVIGLGYVGMPLAIAFAKKINVIGFDVNKEKIELYKQGIDVTNEVGNKTLKETKALMTSDETKLKEAKFHIIAVPTPINDDKTPDLRPIIGASRVLGRNLTKGSIVVYESTVYPGVTEEVCIPILEKESNMKCGVDFKVGYSPERINPGDKLHRLENITKVVSGMDEESLENIASIYELIIEAGVHRAESIKVAEAAKVIENSQRDINIAFVNELSMIFNKMEIDTKAVLEASGTKWNFLKFYPGLVGGHCIGVDPYYLTHKAEQIGYHSQVILSGRRINDGMGKYVGESTVKNLIKANKQVKGAKVAILGMTFKEDCPDVRNSKVIDIINELKEYGINVFVADPIADENEVKREYGIELTKFENIKNMDAVIVAVGHKEYMELNLESIKKLYEEKPASLNSEDKLVLADVKGIFDKKEAQLKNYLYWRL
ncbi:nucleotide sugar dehydrogenase [Paraclostridium bifermentans]|uniref:nucleotide sugar dehydrogenase n=1 Tax=Paraclostridium bifermentans TaxID=1490 RepID=UPI001FF2477F|nr:nucleotide sugar dehydrogenase [Paraclostridium bifermentans]UOW67218.1 nucleotide sugar dehydrogenase [Paraclostridium bifermentans]